MKDRHRHREYDDFKYIKFLTRQRSELHSFTSLPSTKNGDGACRLLSDTIVIIMETTKIADIACRRRYL